MADSRKFKAVRRRTGKKAATVLRDGVDGTGVVLRFSCGFCKDRDGRPTEAFRSLRERQRHATVCPR